MKYSKLFLKCANTGMILKKDLWWALKDALAPILK
jgi:hypothetical protein